ncbi:maleylpyruvate isomerase N-terminal domain-containing protein [Nonomuraea sp. PA05]|uniref:maleylpyruvate isomerase N-terminal domain-containing protein n=1 Tax=Nonomuraea sp. PA05 TaxID=2604466 RepID=UPI001651F0E3|nr:maleylpyruvate isomerase N-terminal domain-containing protein [Nonomuraea sp. PA05]
MSDQRRALMAGVALLERAIDYSLGSLRIVTPAALCRPTPCAGWSLQELLKHLDDSLQALNEAATGHLTTGHLTTGRPTAADRLRTERPPGRRLAATPPAHDDGTSPARGEAGILPGRGDAGEPSARGGAGVPPVRGGAGVPPVRGGAGVPPVRAANLPPVPRAADVPSARGEGGVLSVGGDVGVSPARLHPNPALTLRDTATEVLGRWAAATTADLITVHDRPLTSPMVAAVGAIEVAVHAWDVARACGEHHPIPSLLAEELLDLAHLFVTRADRPARFGPPVTVPMCAPAQDHLLAHLGRHPAWPALG